MEGLSSLALCKLRICMRIQYDTKFDMDQQVNMAKSDTNMIISAIILVAE